MHLELETLMPITNKMVSGRIILKHYDRPRSKNTIGCFFFPSGKGQRSLGKKLQLKLPVEIKGTQAAKLDS